MKRFELEIEKIVAGGDGLARHEGRVVFVPGTVPGERHQVETISEKKNFIRARSVALLESAEHRREAPCPYYGRCGGCSLMHLLPAAALEAKRDILLESLARERISHRTVTATPFPETGYRTRMRLHLSRSGNELVMGFRGRASHAVHDIEHCLLASGPLNATWRAIRSWFHEDTTRAHGLKSIELQESSHQPGRIIGRFLVQSSHGVREFEKRDSFELLEHAGLQGFIVEAERGGGRELRVGSPIVEHRVGELMLRQTAGSFFQANRFALDQLVQIVAPKSAVARWIDLYCGVGLFSLPFASAAGELFGVESASRSLSDAKANAKAAGQQSVRNVRFIQQDAAAFAEAFSFKPDDIVILDPPRGGLPRALCERLVASSVERLHYVSCDPPAFARDARLLVAGGFEIKALELVDLFPNTHHFETIASFIRRPALSRLDSVPATSSSERPANS